MKFNCTQTGIGSLPFTDPQKACSFLLERCPQIPFWAQLPKKNFKENMYTMFSEHLPGLNIDPGRIFLDSSRITEIEEFYSRILEDPLIEFAISEDYASALHEFLAAKVKPAIIQAVKGQVTGPVSFGLQISDEQGKPSLYNELLADIIVKNIVGIIRWQEKVLTRFSKNTIILIDEPYMSLIGSTIVSLDPNKVRSMINELVSAVKGLVGIHCCANTDWSLILGTKVDIISFDAYEYSDNFLLFRDEISEFITRGGTIAWGIVPTSNEQLSLENPESLYLRFNSFLSRLEEAGIPQEKILSSSLITPACGLGTRDLTTASRAFDLLTALSTKIKQEYSLE